MFDVWSEWFSSYENRKKIHFSMFYEQTSIRIWFARIAPVDFGKLRPYSLSSLDRINKCILFGNKRIKINARQLSSKLFNWRNGSFKQIANWITACVDEDIVRFHRSKNIYSSAGGLYLEWTIHRQLQFKPQFSCRAIITSRILTYCNTEMRKFKPIVKSYASLFQFLSR